MESVSVGIGSQRSAIFALIDAEPRYAKDNQRVIAIKGRIEFCDVDFSYNDKETITSGF
ncbi:MAG: hypothetical protein R2867_24415 [Caldilineaceae bacterium]